MFHFSAAVKHRVYEGSTVNSFIRKNVVCAFGFLISGRQTSKEFASAELFPLRILFLRLYGWFPCVQCAVYAGHTWANV